ncbi:class I SAM-dependent methyltransferase [Thalassotalea sp. ND16A]|uniref:class I SAM-dependent methyltransferase n=1 Tax=Thalassotalea sp. ND16A TaxID=1535422 RepID=UPI00051A3AA7|nr:class I SAM-dependent methyltransferase [Thalassotalea sp. ND16A]KGJ90473.1 hypothetical protein ND16A_1869 [Thalassotalea sp. ND16A]
MSDYYNNNAQQFFSETVNVDMRSLYDIFLPLIPIGGSILDAGCGSGRDAKRFMDYGFQVYAFDASAELAAKATELLNQKVDVTTFQTLNLTQQYDGIWACASLLHVPKSELKEAIHNLANHLKGNGVFYASFKYGNTEREHNGRNFTDLNESLLGELVSQLKNLAIKETWLTGDNRPSRESEKWLNVILIKRME